MSLGVYHQYQSYLYEINKIKQELFHEIKEKIAKDPENYRGICYKVAKQLFDEFKKQVTAKFDETYFIEFLPATFQAESTYFNSTLPGQLKKILESKLPTLNE